MHKRFLIILYRLGFAGLTGYAMWRQFHFGIDVAHFQASNFFSFFTIESNILACIVFLFGSYVVLRGKPCARFDWLRGAVTVYMVTTGLIYALLLSGNEVALQTTIPWVNAVVHQIMPLAVLADWILVRPSARINHKQVLGWLAFPVAYLVYSLLRGPHVDWYPYPFIDPRPHGYRFVAIYSLVIAVVVLGIAYGVRWIGNWNRTLSAKQNIG